MVAAFSRLRSVSRSCAEKLSRLPATMATLACALSPATVWESPTVS